MVIGVNLNVTNNGCKSIHAEVCAINKLKKSKKKKGNNVCLVSLRFSNDGTMRNAKPCRDCVKYVYKASIIKGYNIKYVIYSTEIRLVKVDFKTLINNLDQCYISSGTIKKN